VPVGYCFNREVHATMKALIRIAAGAAFVVMCSALLAQAPNPKDVLKAINDHRMNASAQARETGTPINQAALNAEILKVATEATSKVDIKSVSAADAYDWAQVFFIAQKYEETCELCELFLKSNPSAAQKFQAQLLMLNACNAQGEADMILMVLAAVEAPGWSESQTLARQVLGAYSATIAKEKGVDAAIKAIESVEKQVIYETPDAYAQRMLPSYKRNNPTNRDGSAMTEEQMIETLKANANAVNDNLKFSFVRRKAELFAEADRKKDAIDLLDSFIRSSEPSNPLVRQAQTTKSQLTLVESKAPALSFTRQHGNFTSLEDMKGKVVLLQFTAHWCGPCKASYPDVRKTWDDLKDQGFEVVMITRFYGYYGTERDLTPDQEFAKMDGFLKEHNMPFPMLFTENDAFSSYGVSGIPHMVLVGRDGTVKALQIGYSAPSFAEFRKKIEAALRDSN
jgi:peroxiredoxin